MNAKFLVVSMMGLGLSAMGCMQDMSDDELAALDYNEYLHGLAPEDPVGGSTTNELSPAYYQDHKYELFAAMNYSLRTYSCNNGVCSYTTTLNSQVVDTGILSTVGGRKLFTKAVECAIAENTSVRRYSGLMYVDYYGKGLMGTTSNWATGALTTSQKEDVLRCVIARINFNAVEVPIVLTGQNVVNKTSGGGSVQVERDALWDVKILNTFIGPVITEYVWPLAEVTGSSSAGCTDTVSAMNMRLCGHTQSCGFIVRENVRTDCRPYTRTITLADNTTKEQTYFKCDPNNPTNGRPVVESWANAEGVVLMYDDCNYILPTVEFFDPSIFNGIYPQP